MAFFDFFPSSPSVTAVEPAGGSPALRHAIAVEREKRGVEVSTQETSSALSAALGFGSNVGAGVTVTQKSALGHAAVWACVNNISQDLAGLPCQLFTKTGSGIEPNSGRKVTRLLNLQASPLQNSFHLRQSMAALLLLRGNAYARIERDGRQEPVALYYKHPDETEMWPLGGHLWYERAAPARPARS